MPPIAPPIVFPIGPNANKVSGTIIAIVNIGVNKFLITIGKYLSKNFCTYDAIQIDKIIGITDDV